jgi:hypothetical protein
MRSASAPANRGAAAARAAPIAIRRIHHSTRLDSGWVAQCEGPVTDSIQNPDGPAGSEGRILVYPKPASWVVEYLADHACVHAERAREGLIGYGLLPGHWGSSSYESNADGPTQVVA